MIQTGGRITLYFRFNLMQVSEYSKFRLPIVAKLMKTELWIENPEYTYNIRAYQLVD